MFSIFIIDFRCNVFSFVPLQSIVHYLYRPQTSHHDPRSENGYSSTCYRHTTKGVLDSICVSLRDQILSYWGSWQFWWFNCLTCHWVIFSQKRNNYDVYFYCLADGSTTCHSSPATSCNLLWPNPWISLPLHKRKLATSNSAVLVSLHQQTELVAVKEGYL